MPTTKSTGAAPKRRTKSVQKPLGARMATLKAVPAADPSAEQTIKEAARRLFMKNGFSATRTRDIAEEAGMNLALLNYYFRSKENLFALIMMENLQSFMLGMKEAFNDEATTLDEKVSLFVNKYVDMLTLQPDLPLFIFTALRTNPMQLTERFGAKAIFMESHFAQQYKAAIKAGKINPIPPLHFIMNLVGMTVFPFVGRPLIEAVGNLEAGAFDSMMQQRRAMIPQWIAAIMKVKR